MNQTYHRKMYLKKSQKVSYEKNKLSILFYNSSLLVILIIVVNVFYPHFGYPINVEQAKIDKINNTVFVISNQLYNWIFDLLYYYSSTK